MERVVGKVKWFDVQKRFGFIEVEEESDVFLHYSAIRGVDHTLPSWRGAGYRIPNEGDSVEFTIEETQRGPHAKDLIVLDVEDVEGPITRAAFG